jgi:HAD superfamily hydrolase (TIGR01509 family)
VQLPDAVLWDLDGTLVDTEPYWIDAQDDLAALHGVTWTHEHAMGMVGMALLDAAQLMIDAGVPMAGPAVVDHLVERVVARLRERIPWRPGARELLSALADAGVPCALVTMSYRVIADIVVAASPPGAFGVVVTGDSVTHGKPHPEPYLLAVEKLGVDAARSVAIEDSPTGLASATAAGTRPLAIPHVVPVPATAGRSRVGSLTDVTLTDLATIASGTPLDRLA